MAWGLFPTGSFLLYGLLQPHQETGDEPVIVRETVTLTAGYSGGAGQGQPKQVVWGQGQDIPELVIVTWGSRDETCSCPPCGRRPFL